jgi:hypothetical protein
VNQTDAAQHITPTGYIVSSSVEAEGVEAGGILGLLDASSRCEKALSLAAIEAIDGNWHQWLVEAERSRDAARR